MKHNLILILFLGIASNVFCQIEKAKQPILNLNSSELERIGVFFKDSQIIVKNDMPMGENFYLIIDDAFRPKMSDKVDFTKFDFYPYYITSIDSLSGYLSQNGFENELKGDPIFERKMKLNYLIPVRVEMSPQKVFLFWFQPTESFCKLIPETYSVTRKYIPDTLIHSNAAIELYDDELRKIGFVIDDEEMYLRTCLRDNLLNIKLGICEWHNSKKETGTSVLSADTEEYINYKDKKNKKFDILKTDYFIVRVSDADGKILYNNADYDGLVVPIFINNKSRPYINKQEVIIFLSYTPSLVKKMDDNIWNGWWSNPARYTKDIEEIDLLWE